MYGVYPYGSAPYGAAPAYASPSAPPSERAPASTVTRCGRRTSADTVAAVEAIGHASEWME